MEDCGNLVDAIFLIRHRRPTASDNRAEDEAEDSLGNKESNDDFFLHLDFDCGAKFWWRLIVS